MQRSFPSISQTVNRALTRLLPLLSLIYALPFQINAQTAAATPDDNGSAWLYVILAVLIVGLAGAAYFWRQSKKAVLPAQTNSQRNPTAQVESRERRSVGEPRNIPVTTNEAAEAWVQSSLARHNGKNVANGQTTAKVQLAGGSTASNANSALGILPDLRPAQPLEPLLYSDDESLLEAIEQVHMQDEEDEEVRELSLRVLSAFRSQNAVEALEQVALYDSSAKLRIAAVQALGEYDHEIVFEPILLACADPAREVRAAAARSLIRLNIERGDAFARIIESNDPERLRLAALACVEAGLAARAVERLVHQDPKQSYEALAIINILVRAGEFAPILNTIQNHSGTHVRLATIKLLKQLQPPSIAPEVARLMQRDDLPLEVRESLGELNALLAQTV